MRRLAGIGIAFALAGASPAAACSVKWASYAASTRRSDVVLVVEVLTPKAPATTAGSDLNFAGESDQTKRRVLTQLKGAPVPRPLTISLVNGIEEFCPGILMYPHEPGETYYVWLDRQDGHYVYTRGVPRSRLSALNRRDIAAAAGR